MAKLLDDLLVIDFTWALSGPFCTATLADMGARVIKIESPGVGDGFRQLGPFVNGHSAYFSGINRGKESIVIDLKQPQGVDLAKRLVAVADVLVENFRPGIMERFGLAYADLRSINPRLVYLSISGFGQTGPYANLPAFDIVVQAMSGVMSVTGPEGGAPTRVGVSIGDLIPALYGAVSVLGGLHHRDLTGEGCHIDLGMMDCLVAVAENAIARYWATGETPGPIGNRHPVITPFSTFTTADGYIVIAVGNIGQWERFCTAVGRPDLISHPDFESNEARTRNVKLVTETLNQILSANTTDHWLSLLQAAEVPCSQVNSIADVMGDPHLRFRNMLVDVEHPEMGCQTIPGTPIKAIGFDDSITKPAPRLGEHTDTILKELLGLSEEEVNRLIVERVV